MYRVMFSLTAISFSLVILLMPLFAEAKTYKDTDAVRVEYQSFNGVSIWGEKGDAIDAHGYIWRPDPSEFSGQRPAIILMPGIGGQDGRDNRMCEMFSKNGILCLGVRVYASRGIPDDMKTSQKHAKASAGSRLFDAYAALNYLVEREQVDKSNIWLGGYSLGGTATTIALNVDISEKFRISDVDFVGYANLYGSCLNFVGSELKPNVVFKHFIGSADGAWNEEACNALQDRFSQAGIASELTLFQGGQFTPIAHMWDWMKQKKYGVWTRKRHGDKWPSNGPEQYSCGPIFDVGKRSLTIGEKIVENGADIEMFNFLVDECGVVQSSLTANHKVTKAVDEALVQAINNLSR